MVLHGQAAYPGIELSTKAEPGLLASVSCRLYRNSRGKTDGAASARQFRTAVRHPVTVVADTDGESWLDAFGRGGQRRIAPAE